MPAPDSEQSVPLKKTATTMNLSTCELDELAVWKQYRNFSDSAPYKDDLRRISNINDWNTLCI